MTLLPPISQKKVRESPAFPPPSIQFANLINRFDPSPETVVLFLAVLVGGSTGVGIVTFHNLIQLINNFMLKISWERLGSGVLGL